ncbi:30398_t:CDS:1 [Racocetra persica]|uniref:30398_t:CDS:1 n=1 Tax=Racocetra persica TaxID=160502 RepID=A0ACA9PY16_9GLOM|nr:30398_t:CDS:1 [Racocetra persica]
MTDFTGKLDPNPSQIRILSWDRFSNNKENKTVFVCELADSYGVHTGNGYWKTIGLSFPKTENDKIAKLKNILRLNTLNPNDKKKTFLLTQVAGDVALPHSPLEFGFTSVKGGQVMVFNSPDLDFFAIPNLYYDIKNEELNVEVNGFNYQASEKKIILEITKQDLKEHNYKAAVPVAKIIFSGNNPGKLAEIHKIIEYNFNKNEKQFTIKQIEE